MTHIHRRFSDDQVKHLFRLYVEGQMDRTQVEETLKIGKTRFFSLLKLYRSDPRSFSMAYHRRSPQRLPDRAECLIRDYLLEERAMIEDPDLPISSYNYSATRERLLELGIRVSLSTIIDASLHRWSPFAEVKWTLISSLDDYSRKILYADFFEKETTWSHLQASEALVRRYGLPLQYYVDSLRVFRFVRSRDSFWYKTVLKTDEVNPQWKQAMTQLGIDVIYALSPQAKGKIERSYRWMQDRIVRTAAREKLVTLEQLRPILQQEVYRHNHQRVHSTTGEIPHIRFQRALKSGQSFFRPFALPAPYTSPKDIFCLKETRTVNPYRRIEFYKTTIPMPKVPIGQEIEIHLVPNMNRRSLHLRFWWENRMIHSQVFPLDQFPRVHF